MAAPLILIGLAFFVVGLLAGLVSSMPAMLRLRMENGRLKRELRVARETPVVVERTAHAAADLNSLPPRMRDARLSVCFPAHLH